MRRIVELDPDVIVIDLEGPSRTRSSTCSRYRAPLSARVAMLVNCTVDASIEVMYPGEVEYGREQERPKNGIEVDDKTWKAFADLAKNHEKEGLV